MTINGVSMNPTIAMLLKVTPDLLTLSQLTQVISDMESITAIGEIVKGDPPFYSGGPFTFMPDEHYRELMQVKLRGLKPGDKIRLVIDNDVNWHSEKQRRFFHKLCRMYGKDEGIQMDLIEVKNLWKARYGVSEELLIEDERYLMMKSTAVYTRKEYKDLIEGAISDCHREGVVIDSLVVEHSDPAVTKFYEELI